jgi:hypothetical protein
MRKQVVLVVLIGFLVAGCTSIGPKTVPRDRFDYNQAISDSWKEQTLLNIVKLRYADMPLFVEVASIVSGYTLESSVNLGAKVFDGGSGIRNHQLGHDRRFRQVHGSTDDHLCADYRR